MTDNPSVESNDKRVELNVKIEETFEELEERIAPKLATNHNEMLVIDTED